MTIASDVVLDNAAPSAGYASDQEVRWCPGCGDYSILKQVETVRVITGVSIKVAQRYEGRRDQMIQRPAELRHPHHSSDQLCVHGLHRSDLGS